MNRRRTRQIATGAAVALLATGGGAAYAASSDSGSGSGDRQRHVLPGPDGDTFALPAEPPEPGERPDPGEHPRGVFGIAGPGAPFEGAADYLGLGEDELLERLRDGRTLAEIARAQSRSVDGLKDALLDAARERLDEAVENGPLPEEMRDRMLDGLRDHVDDLIESRLPEGLPRPRGDFDGPRFKGFGGGCGPFGDRGGDEDHGRAAPRDEQGEQQDGSTAPGSWDGEASDTVTA